MTNPIYERSQAIVDSLSSSEITSIYNYLKFFKPKNLSRKTTKLELLLDQLNGKKTAENRKKPPCLSFKNEAAERKTYETLENRIVDSLLLDINLYRNGKYDSAEHQMLTLSKELLKAQVLKQRGNYQRAYQLADQVISHADKCESYDHSIEAINLQLSMISMLDDIGDFQEKLSKLQHLEFCRLGKRKAVYFFYELKLKKFYHVKENFDMFLISSEKELSKLAERTGSRIIDYIKHFFVKEILEEQGELHEAFRYIEQLWNIGLDMYRRTPLIDPWELTYEQARLSYRLQLYRDSAMFSAMCQKRLSPENEIYQKAMVQEFSALCMVKSYSQAGRIAKRALNSEYLGHKANGVLQSKWYYLSAVLSFLQGNFKRSIRMLLQTQKMEKSRIEYNLLIRLLRFINFVEAERWDDCDRELHLMDKYVRRNQLDKMVKELGIGKFINYMKELRLESYNFYHFSHRIDEVVDEIVTDQQEAKIKMDLYDLISYGHWFKAKIKDESPDFFIELYISDRQSKYYDYGIMVS